MPLPTNWTTVTCTGTYVNFDGSVPKGEIVFISPRTIEIDGVLVVPRRIIAPLNSVGSFVLNLPATDDPDISSQGWAYTVREEIPGGRPPYMIVVAVGSGPIVLTGGAAPLVVDELTYQAVYSELGRAETAATTAVAAALAAANSVLDATVIRHGTGVPDVSLGGLDDFYLDTLTSRLYGPKAETWGAGVTLVGPIGPVSTVPGPKGDQGDPGADSVVPGPMGPTSTVPGPKGDDGPSAYQIALNNGFVGTQAAWLASLEGADGINGADGESAYAIAVAAGFVGDAAAWLASLQGYVGADGADGISAYEVAVAAGFVGNQAAWLASLQGADGNSAYQIAINNGFVGSEAAWLASLEGAAGPAGQDSTVPGPQGDPGPPGQTPASMFDGGSASLSYAGVPSFDFGSAG